MKPSDEATDKQMSVSEKKSSNCFRSSFSAKQQRASSGLFALRERKIRLHQ
jgi:hypothetical protein